LQIPITRDTLRKILAKDETLKCQPALPRDAKRVDVTAAQIQSHFATLSGTIEGARAHFVFNMDEMGHQEWSAAHQKICIVPVGSDHDQLYYLVPRTGKRVTLIGCISADGSFLKPTVVIPRKTYDEHIELLGLTSEKVIIYHQSKGYIDRAIFED
jgi:hypothetical protein